MDNVFSWLALFMLCCYGTYKLVQVVIDDYYRRQQVSEDDWRRLEEQWRREDYEDIWNK